VTTPRSSIASTGRFIGYSRSVSSLVDKNGDSRWIEATYFLDASDVLIKAVFFTSSLAMEVTCPASSYATTVTTSLSDIFVVV
jgi:hypothetical protein